MISTPESGFLTPTCIYFDLTWGLGVIFQALGWGLRKVQGT